MQRFKIAGTYQLRPLEELLPDDLAGAALPPPEDLAGAALLPDDLAGEEEGLELLEGLIDGVDEGDREGDREGVPEGCTLGVLLVGGE